MNYREVDKEVDKQLQAWLRTTAATPINSSVEGFIKNSHEFLNLLSDTKVASFIYNYSAGNYYYFNDYFTKLIGASRDYIERVGIRIMQDKVHPEDFLKCLSITQQAIGFFSKLKDSEKDSTQFRFFFRLKKESGDYFWVVQSNRHIKWDSNQPSLDLSFLMELFDQNHPMKVIGVLETSEQRIDISPSGEVELLYSLSPREMEVLRLVAMGLSSDEISEKLIISLHTVKSHRKNILKKLEVKNMMKAAQMLEAFI